MEEKIYDSQLFEHMKYRGEVFENYRFTDCEFKNCAFEDCKLLQCSFNGCTFYNCAVTNLKAAGYSRIREAEFTECSLVGLHWNELMPDGKFAEPVRRLQSCRLKYNTFSNMNFRRFDFSNQDIFDSMFAECQLSESNFRSARLDKTEFYKCDIRKADFRDASGYQIDIMSTKLGGARFSFPEAVNLLNGLGIKID